MFEKTAAELALDLDVFHQGFDRILEIAGKDK